MMKYDNAIKAKPIACFKGETGSFPFALNLSQRILKGTASSTTNRPLKICTIDAGICQPNKNVLSVWLDAMKVNDEPACSKAAQKKIMKNECRSYDGKFNLYSA